MGSLPSAHTGVGSGTNGSFMQVGGALGVAVVGSLLSTRYQHHLSAALAPYRIPHATLQPMLGSLGGALAAVKQIGGPAGQLLSGLARAGFVSGMDLGLLVGAGVALAGALLALVLLPARAEGGEQARPGPVQRGTSSASSSSSSRFGRSDRSHR
jgi:hypothetical protein